MFLTDGTATRDLALRGRVVLHDDVQAATLAAQADGFSTLADVGTCAGCWPRPPGSAPRGPQRWWAYSAMSQSETWRW